MSALVYDYRSIAAHMKGELAPAEREDNYERALIIHKHSLTDEQVSRLQEEWISLRSDLVRRPMTREEFVRGYAVSSGLSAEWAALGLVDAGRGAKIVLPCGCGDESCPGWTMLSAEAVLHHLEFDAPEPLREAYRGLTRSDRQ